MWGPRRLPQLGHGRVDFGKRVDEWTLVRLGAGDQREQGGAARVVSGSLLEGVQDQSLPDQQHPHLLRLHEPLQEDWEWQVAFCGDPGGLEVTNYHNREYIGPPKKAIKHAEEQK